MKTKRKRQDWKQGDLFVIPLSDNTNLVGQVLAVEREAMNSVNCAIFSLRCNSDSIVIMPRLDQLVSVQFTSCDQLNSGRWKVIGSSSIIVPRQYWPFESLRASRFVGAHIIGSGIIEAFANALCGLSAWDDWADPAYLDSLLITPEKKPANLVYKKRH
jgi:hypothetical protein